MAPLKAENLIPTYSQLPVSPGDLVCLPLADAFHYSLLSFQYQLGTFSEFLWEQSQDETLVPTQLKDF